MVPADWSIVRFGCRCFDGSRSTARGDLSGGFNLGVSDWIYWVYNKIFTVIETPVFQRTAVEIWTPDERFAFIDWLACNPEVGKVIPGTGGLRKVRWTRTGMGKRGGVRVVYYLKTARGELWLLIVYSKSKFDDLPAVMLRQWKDAIDG